MNTTTDPKTAKFIGLVSIAIGLLSLFSGFIALTIFAIGYGGICLFYPKIIFPTEKEAEERAAALRENAIQASSSPVSWYYSPAFLLPVVALLAFAVYELS